MIKNRKSGLVFVILLLLFSVICEAEVLDKKELAGKADQLFHENQYQAALKIYAELTDRENLAESQHIYWLENKAYCEYYLHYFKDAENTLQKSLKVYPDDIYFITLLGKVYYYTGRLNLAIDNLKLALDYYSFLDFDYDYEGTVYLLSRVYTEKYFQQLGAGNERLAYASLQSAYNLMLDNSLAGSDNNYEDEYQLWFNYLSAKLKNYHEIGKAIDFQPGDYTENELMNLAASYLTDEQQKVLKYPFSITPEMQKWVQENFNNLEETELSKINRLYRYIYSDAGLRLATLYDYQIYADKKGYWQGRTATEVFNELYYIDDLKGINDEDKIGLNPDLQYRLGDCDSTSNLFIALARAIGLKAYKIRVYNVEEHMAVGIITRENRLIIVDTSYYMAVDVPLQDYKLLDDREYYSYYLMGFGSSGYEPYYQAALKLYPQNENILVAEARKAVIFDSYAKAEKLLVEVPESAYTYYDYWDVLGYLKEQEGKTDEGLAAMEKSREYLEPNTIIFKREARLLEDKGDLEGAIAKYKVAIKYNPEENYKLWKNVADLEVKRGNIEEAVTAYNTILYYNYDDETYADVDYNIASAYLTGKDYQEALKYYLQTVQDYNYLIQDGKISADYYLIGEVKDKVMEITNLMKDKLVIKMTASYLTNQVTEYPEMKILKIALLHLDLKQDKNTEAEEILHNLLEQDISSENLKYILQSYEQENLLTDAINYLQPYLTRQDFKKQISDYFVIANFVFDKKLDQVALINYQKIRNLLHDNWSQAKKLLDTTKFNQVLLNSLEIEKQQENWSQGAKLVDILLEQQKYSEKMIIAVLGFYQAEEQLPEGLTRLEKLIVQQQEQKNLWWKMGLAAYNKGDLYDYAKKYFAQEIAVRASDDPNLDLLYRNLALCARYLNDIPEAEKYYLKSLSCDPGYELALQNLLDLYYEQNKQSAAEEIIAQLSRKEKLSVKRIDDILGYYHRVNKLSQGIDLLVEVIPEKENQVELWTQLLLDCHQYQDDETVVRYADQVIFQPANKEYKLKINRLMGEIYLNKNDLVEAEVYYREALKYGDSDVDTNIALLQIYNKQQLYSLAAGYLQKGLQINPLPLALLKPALNYYIGIDKLKENLTGLVSRFPEDKYTDYLNTAATVLYKLDKCQIIIPLYQEAIANTSDPAAIFNYQISLARIYQKAGEEELAEKYYQKASQYQADSAYLLQFYAPFLVQRNKMDQADNLYTELLKLDLSKNTESQIIDEMLTEYQKPDSAERCLTLLLKLKKADKLKLSWQELGDKGYYDKYYQTALTFYLQAEKAGNTDTSLYKNISLCYEKLGDDERAQIYLKKGAQFFEDTVVYYLKEKDIAGVKKYFSGLALDVFMSNTEIAMIMDEAKRQNLRVEMFPILEKYIGQRTDKGFIFSALAGYCLETNLLQEAMNYYQEAEKLFQNDQYDLYYVYCNLGLVYERLEKYEMAGEYYQKALQIQPDFTWLQERYFRVLIYQKKYQAVKTLLDSYLTNDPENELYYIWQGDYYIRIGKIKQARSCYQLSLKIKANTTAISRLISYAPDEPSRRKYIIQYWSDYEKSSENMYYLLSLYGQKGEFEKAYKLFAAEIQSEDYISLVNKIFLLTNLQKNQEAREYIDDHQFEFEKNSLINWALGLIEYNEDNLDQALAYFEKVPSYSGVYYNSSFMISVILNQEGRYRELVEYTSKPEIYGNLDQLNTILSLIDMHLALGELNQAEEYLNIYARYYPERAETFILEAVLSYKKGDTVTAYRKLLKASAFSSLTDYQLKHYFGLAKDTRDIVSKMMESI